MKSSSHFILSKIAVSAGLLLSLLVLLLCFYPNQATWGFYWNGTWAFLVYLAGVLLYFAFPSQAGMRSLLAFQFLEAVFWIFYLTPEDWLPKALGLSALAFLPALLRYFSPLISLLLIDKKPTILGNALVFLPSTILVLLSLALLPISYWRWSTLSILVYLVLVYGWWLIFLWKISIKPKLAIEGTQARKLLWGQIFGFITPFAFFSSVFGILRLPIYPYLAPFGLLFSIALGLPLWLSKRDQREVYIVQSEKRRSFGGLLAGLTHEINNPLNFIYSNMEPMKEMLEALQNRIPAEDLEGKNLAEDLRKMAQDIEGGVERVKALIDQFRGFPKSRPEVKEEVDLNSVIQKCIDLLGHKWKDRISIVTSFGDVPKIRGFSGEIGQVFTNLLANACDATPQGGSVNVTTQRNREGIIVSIHDSGQGIPKEHISKIFDPFFTTKGQGEGTGLGLSIAMQIIKSHHGSIEVQSEPGRGTEFFVILPT